MILGSVPSIKSREENFYYAHKQNKFWHLLSDVYNEKVPLTVDEKITFLLKHNIALWDVIKSCTIKNSSDSSIKNVKPNNIKSLINKTKIEKIYTTGKKAYYLYNKFIYNKTKIEAIYLPSPSPANASMNYDSILEIYKDIRIN